MEIQRYLKILCRNDMDNFEIVDRWVTHSDLAGTI